MCGDARGSGRGRTRSSSSRSRSRSTCAGHVQVVVDHRADRPRTRPPTARPQQMRAAAPGPSRTGHSAPAAPCRTRDHEPLADQHRHVAGVDHLGGLGELLVLDVAGGAQHQPGHVADRLQRPAGARRRRPARRSARAGRTPRRSRRIVARSGSCRPSQTNAPRCRRAMPGGLGVVHLARPGARRRVDRAVDHRVRVVPPRLGAAALGSRRIRPSISRPSAPWPSPPRRRQPEHPPDPSVRRVAGRKVSGGCRRSGGLSRRGSWRARRPAGPSAPTPAAASRAGHRRRRPRCRR